jgi:predicted dehydrogenase
MTMSVGVCGLGGMGLLFSLLLHHHPDVGEIQVADLDPGLRQNVATTGLASRVVEHFDQLLDSDLDAVVLFTPPWTHADMTVRALDAGKHVLCACPVGLTTGELARVVLAVERTGRIYMSAETSYYYLYAMFCRQAWHEGRFGEFVYAEGEYYHRPEAYEFWLRDGYATMPPVLYPTHSTTPTVSVLERPWSRVTCVGTPGLRAEASAHAPRPEWAHNTTVNMTMLGELAGGGVVRVNEFRNVGCKGELGSFFGTQGSIRMHSGGAVWTNGLVNTAAGAEDVLLHELWRDPAHHPQMDLVGRLPEELRSRWDEHPHHEHSHVFLVDEFVRSVVQNRRPHNNVWLAARCTAPGIAAWTSFEAGGAWTDVADFGAPTDGREPLPY